VRKLHVASAAENGHFRIGRKIPRAGITLELTDEEISVLQSDERIRLSDAKEEKPDAKTESKPEKK
jgi:hypothetical protein